MTEPKPSFRETRFGRIAGPSLLGALFATCLGLSLTTPPNTTLSLTPRELRECQAVGCCAHEELVTAPSATPCSDDRPTFAALALPRNPLRISSLILAGTALALALLVHTRRCHPAPEGLR
jgi:hypothetical protein